MYIKLEQEDYDAIAELIADQDDSCDSVSYSDLDIMVYFSKYTTSHREDDYNEGTGAWVTDSVDFELDELECEGLSLKYSRTQLERTINDYLSRY